MKEVLDSFCKDSLTISITMPAASDTSSIPILFLRIRITIRVTNATIARMKKGVGTLISFGASETSGVTALVTTIIFNKIEANQAGRL